MNYHYTVFGLQVNSQIPLTAFRAIPPSVATDVEIRLGKVLPPRAGIENAVYLNGLIYHPEFCYLVLESGSQFLIKKEQKQIIVLLDFKNSAHQQTLLTYFYGTGLSAILNLNNQFAIHASGVIVDNELVLFCGESGVGKSTTAAYLTTQGYPIFTDDKCVLFYNKKQAKWFAYPSLQIVRLWNDAVENLNKKDFLTNPVAVIYNQDKHQFQIKSSELVNATPPLRKVFILTKTGKNERITSTPIYGIQKMQQLQEQIFRRFMIEGFKREFVLWNMISQLAKDIPVELIERPELGNISTFGKFIEKAITQKTVNH